MADNGGLFPIPADTGRIKPELEIAAERHLAYLREAGLMGKQHELAAELVLTLARAVGVGAESAKTSTPLSAAQLIAAMQLLPTVADESTAQKLRETLNAIK